MPVFAVVTAAQHYEALVASGCLSRLHEFVPSRSGRIFAVTTRDVWQLHGDAFKRGMGSREFDVLYFPGGEENKRIAVVEALAEEMAARGGDRGSVVVAFGGGIVTDLGGFLAAVFMRGVPVIQVPTTLLAQVDAGVGGKTGANLVAGKNLIGAFHQPLAVLTDPDVLATLPEREYKAGLQEVVKCGIIRSPELFRLMHTRSDAVLARHPEVVEQMIAESVRIKCEVVSADEREGGLRRILNFGHTVGHAIEAETGYTRLLHGEAVGIGMKAAAHLSRLTGRLAETDCQAIIETVDHYGPLPGVADLRVENLTARLSKDKKTVRGSVHFVLATGIGSTEIVSGLAEPLVAEAVGLALR